MQPKFKSIALASYFTMVWALYYPPTLSPKAGDVMTAGSNFTVIWDTNIPHSIPIGDVANFTSEARLEIYFGPPGPNEVHEQWTLYSPTNTIGAAQPLYLYGGHLLKRAGALQRCLDTLRTKLTASTENQGPQYGCMEYVIPDFTCSDTLEYVIVWYDAYPAEVSSGVLSIEYGC